MMTLRIGSLVFDIQGWTTIAKRLKPEVLQVEQSRFSSQIKNKVRSQSNKAACLALDILFDRMGLQLGCQSLLGESLFLSKLLSAQNLEPLKKGLPGENGQDLDGPGARNF